MKGEQNVGNLWVGIDWGSTHFRAYLFSDERVVKTISTNDGILGFGESDKSEHSSKSKLFEIFLAEQLGKWSLASQTLVLMAGMVGSKNGWLECDYISCPCGADELKSGLQLVSNTLNLRLYIVAGVMFDSTLIAKEDCYDRQAQVDVMRGEELQIIGAAADIKGDFDGHSVNICLPGTHSKWAQLNRGKIQCFNTYMTGELFALLGQHSSLKGVLGADSDDIQLDEQMFVQTLAQVSASASNQALSQQLFSIRALAMTKGLTPMAANSRLSALLIAQEFAQQLAIGAFSHFYLVASKQLIRPYQLAADFYGVECRVLNSQKVTCNGLIQLAKTVDFEMNNIDAAGVAHE